MHQTVVYKYCFCFVTFVFGSGAGPISLLILLLFSLLCLFLFRRPIQEAWASVVSNQIGMTCSRIVLKVNTIDSRSRISDMTSCPTPVGLCPRGLLSYILPSCFVKSRPDLTRELFLLLPIKYVASLTHWPILKTRAKWIRCSSDRHGRHLQDMTSRSWSVGQKSKVYKVSLNWA